MTDIIVIGAGTAGLSAAIYGVRAGKSVLVFEENAYGGQIINTPEIENYPGLYKISGFEYAKKIHDQAIDLGAEIKSERVLSVEDASDHKVVKTKDHSYEAKAVIIASGAHNRELGLEHEKEWVGAGISYCATCDGMFFRKQDVAVNGGGNTAVEDALFLSNYCKKVYVIHRRDQFRGDEASVEKLKEKDNVELVLNATVTKLIGTDGLDGVEVTDKMTGEKRQIPVTGLFVAIGQVPSNDRFKNLVDLDDKGYIVAGEDCQTSTEGIFVAGDCRTKKVRQLITAAADGAVAAIAASEYIG